VPSRPLALDTLVVVVCAIAAWTDLRSRRIYNWLTYPTCLLGLLLVGLLGGWPALPGALVGGLTGLLVFGVMGGLGWMGMGDVKLMAAGGVLLGFPMVLRALGYVALAGGLLGIGMAIARGQMAGVMRNLGRILGRVARPGQPVQLEERARIVVPYGVAIAAGVVYTVLAARFPRLGLF
jgi:prepilin peptidase CpaA